MKLRDYQTAAIQSIYDWFGAGKDAPLIVTPTGSGKSVILAEFIRRAVTEYRDTTILVTTHVKELVEQDARAIKTIWPHASVGIYSAGLGKRQLKNITVASIQSIYRRKEFYGRFDLIIIDEAHLIPHKSSGMYRTLLDHSMKANPLTKLIGLTATPYRLDTGMLHQGEGALFDGISYEANVKDLIEQGYLCPLHCQHGDQVDLSKVSKVGGEYNLGQLSEVMCALKLIEHHADIMVKRCADRNAWLIFCVTVEHASQMTAALLRRGIPASYVSGDMPNAERDQVILDFKQGRTRALVNCQVLTTGFDHPVIDAVVMLRPTLSPGLYVQMIGRGLRMHESKTDCLVLDCGGNVKRHGFIDQVSAPVRGKGSQVPQPAPVKECPQCSSFLPINLLVCSECGHAFPAPERIAYVEPFEGSLLSTKISDVFMDVDQILYSKHVGKSGVPTLRVDYYFGIRRVSEYVCLEHSGFAYDKAARWWESRLISKSYWDIPTNINEALARSDLLMVPKQILVNFGGKYPEIKNYVFEGALA